MDENENSYVGFGLFFLLILSIVVIGTFLIYRSHMDTLQEVFVIDKEENDKLKIEKSKDYIYYIDEGSISSGLSISYKYPVINLDSESAKNLTQELKQLVDEKRSAITKIESGDTCSYGNTDGIKKASILDYGVYSFADYVTLVVYESSYSCEIGFSSIEKMRSYVFNVTTGERVSSIDLLNKYSTSITQVFLLVREKLEEVPTIKVEEAMNALKEQDTYIIYIDESGELLMKYIVKTDTVAYNDTIVLN